MRNVIEKEDLDALNKEDMRALIIQYHEKLAEQHSVIVKLNSILAKCRDANEGQKLVIFHLMKKFVGNSLRISRDDLAKISSTLSLHYFEDESGSVGFYIKDAPEIVRPN